MRKFPFFVVFFCLSVAISAQTVAEEFKNDIHRSATNHLAYPGPSTKNLTPAPDGMKPFYISHYGRHGSRYLINPKDYTYTLDCLRSADSAKVLTPMGIDVMERIDKMYSEADNRFGELSPLGAQQHREIAERMYARFPQVFEGETHIDAKSTVVIRCILSMANELTVFAKKNPKLTFTQDASMHDMPYMNFSDNKLFEQRDNERAGQVYEEFFKRHVNFDYTMNVLFTDTAFASAHFNTQRFCLLLWKLAGTVQNTEGRKTISLYDLFTDNDIYNNWLVDNAWWYVNYGGFTLNGGKQPFSQRRLLAKIIAEADSCISLPHPGATLRFGHETMVMPLTCLLGLNGYDYATDDLESLEAHNWINYKIFPMAANIQFVFYRKDETDKNVMVKVLLNENEATLPLKTDTPPYYPWSDVRSYYLDKLASFDY
ncbi:MAG: histidine-type phosphatase [Prevotella sp.]